MNSFNLKTFLTTNVEIDEQTIKEHIEKLKKIRIKKGNFLLRQGDICKHSFFVEEGLLKYYSIDEKGKQHILQFAPEGWFVVDRESMFFNQPSQYFIETLEDSVVTMMDEDVFAELSLQNKDFALFNNRLLHNHIRHLQNRINLLLSATAEERYLEFVKIYPDLLLRVPQTLVASYLGITPESLSRVRKDLATRRFQK
ncbi:cyclic nucleotide-binding protein [Taibaiella sp. KBW10]|uniref:Crp/Fnr family transcriptional regulator n=1 Tax=Taibaiella sp. KBW10 TaxID=2153357 RepID=UPI000F5B2AB8|nr:Crp/Fnr family transcriptional regulator [Taibaiella sp. KBW10]RQO30592.1 cyclic nucleotide-binding protein [Taibaiella sp. KBW10]